MPTWKTRTRNKLFLAGLIFIALCDIGILIGWLQGRTNAPELFIALNAGGGIWGALNALSIGIEKANNGKPS